MQPGALRALEYQRIVEAVRGYALTPLGDERLARLAPSADAQRVAYLLAATTEAARFVAAHGSFPLRATSELLSTLAALAVEGRALEASRLVTLAAFLESVEQTRTAIRQSPGSFAILEQTSRGAASFAVEIAQTRDKIDPSGDVVDQATPELKSIRERLRRQRTRLRGTLESYLRGKDTARYLQDQVVTERNGRYVLVVRTEHRSAIPGIIHGASTSGASLFLEPLSTVEINNDIVALEEQEAEEVRRILLQLTNAYRSRPMDVQRTIDTATELDVVQARARYSQAIDGIEPSLSADGALELPAARHPLLKKPVPVTITLAPPASVLLITGPNTGGKTVALKTAGLLALMAQSGLHVPAARGARLPVFRTVFADIGDEQSIEASLSTFSAHITSIAAMDRTLAVPALVLLDEVGSGTDPVEGGALGVAIVDHFRRRGATVLATSHYDALKTYASTSEGVVSAAFGFDAESFAPTFELVYGSPGRSLALEVASRLGLSPDVISAARQNLSAREAQLTEHLAKVDRDMRALEHERRLVGRERETLEAAEAHMRQRDESLKQREETFRRRLSEELDTLTRKARRDIDEVIAGLKDRTSALAWEAHRAPVTTGQAGAARARARAEIDLVVERYLKPLPDRTSAMADPSVRKAAVGDRVLVEGLGVEGVVTAIHDGSAELDVRGKRMRANFVELQVLGGGSTPAPKVNVHVELQPRDTTATDLNVIGCSVDEALLRAERFLDESLLGDQRVVRVIHGYGTGQLRRALTGFFQQHPLVARFSPAPPEQGGGGVTVVELKD
jgi:DNA mismatch repair protein MutS2